ncbi:M61 family metallopeptidase [Chitinimonas taiwanensis]|uniref:Predicted metalloprotease, contains C-terminal PDZ domain n=1 Tax=Chitinimonas taiwanensis DSM 18899 TaxID=1121279 RepID=A0A1K2H7Y9_9NEIS|nr:M61 family metallopeptidase [Chitinimonas taiwanensis]SFZ72247.1 Predicted metalloprotease, contains C-terminal PDZ domain [Chitinimonas taiwanensis DSM 18899]
MKPTIHYRISAAHPEAHLFDIRLHIEHPAAEGQRLSLPVWIPGSYLVREFAKHIVSISAEDERGALAISKTDKNHWQLAPAQGAVTVRYTVYGFDLSVRTAYLDTTRAFFNGSSVFLGVDGQLDQPVEVDIVAPSGKAYREWRVATSLPAHKAKPYAFGSYRAADYDELIDHPVEMGDFTLIQFKACGVPHDFVLSGRLPKIDSKRLARDCKKICEHQIRMFGEPAPFERYVFMTFVSGDGYGGLEHRASTALMCKREDLPKDGETGMKSSYRQYLGLVSHEYFHSWNVKRIKPAAYAPYPADGEAYSRLLWAFEGLTSYYDDLTLVRAGLIDADSYLELLSHTITGVLRTPGRLVQNIADSSFDTWIKFYRQDENSPNSGISYYTKGALAGLCLDLHIRQATQGKHSLDDVMLALWERYGRDFYAGKPVGVPEEAWEQVAEEVTGLKLQAQFDHFLRSTEELPLAEMLASVGIQWQARSQTGANDKGGWLDKAKPNGVWLGARTASDGALVKLTHVLSDGPAEHAGLSAGDVLVAIDGLKATAGNLDAALAAAKPGDKLDVLAFRRDELMNVKLKLEAEPSQTVGLRRDDSDPAKLAAREAWLHG